MKLKTTFLILSFAAVPLAAGAAGSAPDMSHAIDPGLWETTVQMQMSGMSVPPQTTRSCMTQADLDKYHGMPKPQNDKGMTCAVTKFDFTGKAMTYTMKCTGNAGNMDMNGSTTLDSRDAYHGTMAMTGSMQGHPMQMTNTYTAKRVGDCTAPAAGSGG